jgi:signal peptidase I
MENESKQGLNNLTKKLVTESWLEKFVNTGSGWLIIISGSMAPLIQIKDQILIKKTTPSHIHLGDIITFWQGNILVTHRVIRKFNKGGNAYFVEKGDANTNYSCVDAKTTIGKVIKINKGGHEIILETLKWNVINRTVGVALFSTYVLRVVGRKAPFIPDWIKSIVRHVFDIAERLRDKIVRTILS